MSFRTYRKYFDRGRSYDVPCLCLKLVTLDRFPPTGKVRAHASICAKTGFGDVAIELDSLGRRNFARIIGAIRRFSPDNGAMLDAAVVPDSI